MANAAYSAQRHGTWAQWGSLAVAVTAVVISLVLGAVNLWLTYNWHNEAGQSKASDDHMNKLIDDKLDPKLEKINERLDQLTKELGQIQGTLRIYTTAQERLTWRSDQQIALSNMTQPKRTEQALAVIRIEVGKAQATKQPLAASAIADYRAAVRDLPDTAAGYWKTVAAVINYQSFLDQKAGSAPGPRSVARPCAGLTEGLGTSNTFRNITISKCVLDLDITHDVLENVTIRNSVIRYHGGPVTVHNAVFIDCYFDVDLTKSPNPSQTQLLRAILSSPDPKTVALANIDSAPG